jgi:hypothetical protein
MEKQRVLIVRGTTNEKSLAKQYCWLAENKSKDFEQALIIKRLVLTENLYDFIKTQHILLRKYKGKCLMGKSFSIKLSTMSKIMDWAKKQ